MPGVSRLCISLKNPFSLFTNEVAPLKFNVIYVKHTTDAHIKYGYIKGLLSDYHLGQGFYSLSAYDQQISYLFHLMDDAYSIQCNCKSRVFNVGFLDSTNKYVQLSNYYGMKVKDIAHHIVDKYNEGSICWKTENSSVKKIIISETTPDQGLRYFTYVLNGNKLCKLDNQNTATKVEESDDVEDDVEEESESDEESDDVEEESEDVEEESDEVEEESDDVEEESEESEDVEAIEADDKRGDDPGDITNCLNTGDIIIHTIDNNTWYGCYCARTNKVYNSLLNKANRGSEACPIQDFVVSHIYDCCSEPMTKYHDNLWTQCFVIKNTSFNLSDKYPILEYVHRFFNKSKAK